MLSTTELNNVARYLMGLPIRSKKNPDHFYLIIGVTPTGVNLHYGGILWETLFEFYETLDGQSLKLIGPFDKTRKDDNI